MICILAISMSLHWCKHHRLHQYGHQALTAHRAPGGLPRRVTKEIDLDQRHLNRGGIVHGGALLAFADDLGGTVAGLNIAEGFRTTTIESKSNIFASTASSTRKVARRRRSERRAR
jgi:hypothetical protein